MLGPLEVRTDDGGLADVPGARLRGLLIALALKPGRVVPKASLIDWIWGQDPPADATNALQRLVSRLRKALPDGAIEGQTDGYRLRAALGLWRGAAMQDIGLLESPAFDAAVVRLEELRLTATEELADAEIAL